MCKQVLTRQTPILLQLLLDLYNDLLYKPLHRTSDLLGSESESEIRRACESDRQIHRYIDITIKEVTCSPFIGQICFVWSKLHTPQQLYG